MIRLPAEWEKQEYLMVVYPTTQSDWQHSIDEIQEEYNMFIKTITNFQKCIVITNDIEKTKAKLKISKNIEFIDADTNDTWIRDFGAISIYKDKKLHRYNFRFNAWGGKFESTLDNELNKKLLKIGIFDELEDIDFILEGGSIDSNGEGVMLTTSKCIFNPNRNKNLSKNQITKRLKELFWLKKLIILEHGELIGDDTDAHIDTLARFITKDTIVYNKCYDEEDEHFKELEEMEKELLQTGFKLIPLPLPNAKIWKEERLPATYINFLFINDALIVPMYNDINDKVVLNILKEELPHLNILGVSASVFIREHGSLHCGSMNFYKKLW